MELKIFFCFINRVSRGRRRWTAEETIEILRSFRDVILDSDERGRRFARHRRVRATHSPFRSDSTRTILTFVSPLPGQVASARLRADAAEMSDTSNCGKTNLALIAVRPFYKI